MKLEKQMKIKKIEIIPSQLIQKEPLYSFTISDYKYDSVLNFDKETLKKYGIKNLFDITENQLILTLESAEAPKDGIEDDILEIDNLDLIKSGKRNLFGGDPHKYTSYERNVLLKSPKSVYTIDETTTVPRYLIKLLLNEDKFKEMNQLKADTYMKVDFKLIKI